MPLFDDTASETSPRVTGLRPMELSNTAWAWAEISASSDASAARVWLELAKKADVTDTQGLTNTLQACGTLVARRDPVLAAISAELPHRRDTSAQSVTTTVWSWWKLSFSAGCWPFIQEATNSKVLLDPMGYSYSIMMAEWEKVEDHEQELFGLMELNHLLPLPIQLFALVSQWRGGCWGGPPLLSLPSVAYRKLAALLDFVETQVSRVAPVIPGMQSRVTEDGVSLGILHAIEHFGSGVGQWLKVAGDSKAQLVEAALRHRPSWSSGACVEMGTFVGYTAIRLARFMRGFGGDGELDPTQQRARPRGDRPGRAVSLEVDAIHALLTRHTLSLARLSSNSEVWVGQALDLIPRLVEELGAESVGFIFMDHRGTRFHSDLFRLQRHGLLPPRCTHVCDNTLKPGAPICMWHAVYQQSKRAAARSGSSPPAMSYSMNEFAHWNSEDWMLVNCFDVPDHGQPRGGVNTQS
ncbi:unnamed protein product [Polarella glacialis]|uniref:Catechol O-methyltransferase n=1 Tax=Polarella glacialis TaxID=89957 RepID=A0A813FL71_POLGL|nr:unnamed protein product [Polarella glacialis]